LCEFELFVDRLTEHARQRARELACDADPRLYGESYIRSPDGDGCQVVPDLCNKCAFTGGKMDRTDLERLISSAAGSAGEDFPPSTFVCGAQFPVPRGLLGYHTSRQDIIIAIEKASTATRGTTSTALSR
jgi:hypothetical protein